jgi:dienelactone hydrolase
MLLLGNPTSGREIVGPDTVVVESGTLRLRGLLWRPAGPGRFPAVLFNHGSGHAAGVSASGLRDERHPDLLGPVFARHGYAFFHLFRRGDGLSSGQGKASGDVMDQEAALHGMDGRNRVQLRLLEGDEMSDVRAGLAFLRRHPAVDPQRLAVVGHSFGGSLTVLLAEREPGLRAAVVFSAAGYSWDHSAGLRSELVQAVGRTKMPILFVQAENDYSLAPSRVMGAHVNRVGMSHRIRIYPPTDSTADQAHFFVYFHVATWEPDVFAFLDQFVRR